MHSFAIQPFKIVLMIPSSCYQIKSPFYKTQYIFSFFCPSHLLTRTTLFWRGLLNSVTLTKIKLPWITSNYKTMQRLKAKKRSQSPPLIPHFNFGYLFITNMSQKNCLSLQKEGVEYSRIHKYQNFPPL